MTTCTHCGRPIEPDDGGRIWFHPDTMAARCDGPDDEPGIGWGDLVRQAEPSLASLLLDGVDRLDAGDITEEEWLDEMAQRFREHHGKEVTA